ncbi:amidohydrolase [uncultured Veillonella sp.]|uniref:amidohydrolase n=1 Tax=uncultured Veillonella sp. TaxID=159268 RepID=UPI0026263AED|nr:amidohydrolase [uncultured Veillonella sp.]
MAQIVIRHIDCITGEYKGNESVIIKDATLLLENGYIKRIISPEEAGTKAGEALISEAIKNAEYVLYGEGKVAAPGFINTHTHVAMGLFRNYADDLELMDWLSNAIWLAEAKLTDELVAIGTQLGIAEMLRSGTTCFNDMYFFMDETANVVKETGIRAVLSRGMAGVAPTADVALQESRHLYNTWHGFEDNRIKVMLGPHAPYTCPDAYMKKVMDLAHELGAQIHVHLCETRTEVEDVLKATGKTPIAHFNDLGVFDTGCIAAHGVHLTDDDMRIMKEKNVRLAHNPQSNLKLASGIANLPALLEKGITVGLGTDGSSSNNNADMLEEVRLAAMLHKATHYDPKVIPAHTALALGTVEGAKVLDYNDLGLIKEGYRADIVLYDVTGMHWLPRYNDVASLVYAANSSDAVTTIVAGKVLMKDRELLTIDEERLRHEVLKQSQIFMK